MNPHMSFRGACDEESKASALGNMGRLRFFTSLRLVQNDILLKALNLGRFVHFGRLMPRLLVGCQVLD